MRDRDPCPSHPGELVDTLGPRNWAQSPGTAVRHQGPSDTGASLPGQLVDSTRLRLGPKSPGRPFRHLRHWNTVAGRPGYQVDPSGHGTRARVAQDSCSTPRTLGPGRKLSGTARRHRGNSDLGPSRLRELVDPRAQEPGPGSPGTSGRYRGTWDMSPSHPGQLVDSAGIRIRA